MIDSIVQGILSFFACLFFAVIYNTPKNELIKCGITGGIGYGIYYYFFVFTPFGPVFSTFMGAAAIVICARIISVNSNLPVMLYILPSVFPLVPGANMYHAMYGLITNNIYTATNNAIEAFKLSGITVFALLVTMSLPVKLFNIFKFKKTNE